MNAAKTLKLTAFSFLSAFSLLLLQPVLAAPLVELTPEAKQNTSGAFKELKQIEKILSDVAKLRDLPVKRPIQIGVLDRSQLEKTLAKQINEEIPANKIKGETALYRQLGMLPKDFNYQKFMVDLYTEQIGGFYDPKTRELNLIKGTPLTGLDQQMLIAHELTHALQDQHYELQKYLSQGSENDDQNLARTSLIEGDATVTAMEYIQQRAENKPVQGLFEMLGSVVNSARQMQSFEKFRSAPKFIQESLTFPYDQGSQFVNAFRQDGWSWSDIKLLYTNPPNATEHILHPSTYLEGQAPQPVNFSLKNYFKGSTVLTGSVWGELSYRQYLAHHLDWREAKDAAQGWQGDRYEVLETPQGKVYGFFSRWDNPEEAKAFFSAWRKSLSKREYSASGMTATGGQIRSKDNHILWAEQKGASVAIIENLSFAHSSSLAAIAKAWQAEASKAATPGKPLPRP